LPQLCRVCHRKDRRRIEAALAAGTPMADVARTHHVSADSIKRHRASGHIAGMPKPEPRPPRVPKPKRVPKPAVDGLAATEVQRLRAPEAEPERFTLAQATTALEPVSLRSPEDVLTALEWSVGETKALLQRAKDAGDLRLQNQLLQTAIGALDKLAKSVGLYSDGTIVNVDAGTRKLEIACASLSTDELRLLLAGAAESAGKAPALPAGEGGAKR
jgi:hypothetical protein